MSNVESLEQQIVALGLTAPRITPEQIDAMVEKLSFHTYVIPGTTTTVASAIDPLGFVVAIDSASCVSAENFNEVFGRNAAISKARAAAKNELWKLEGYRLSKNLVEASKSGLIADLELYQDGRTGARTEGGVPIHTDGGASKDPRFVSDMAVGYCASNSARRGAP